MNVDLLVDISVQFWKSWVGWVFIPKSVSFCNVIQCFCGYLMNGTHDSARGDVILCCILDGFPEESFIFMNIFCVICFGENFFCVFSKFRPVGFGKVYVLFVLTFFLRDVSR